MALSGEQFDMGRVFSKTASSIIDNWMVVLGFAGGMSIVATAASSFSMAAVANTVSSTDPAAVMAIFTSFSYWGSLLVGMIISIFGQAGLLSAFCVSEERGSVSFSDCITGGLRSFFPLFILTILWGLGVWLGLVLLIVPGLILITVWSVAAPALVSERQGIFAAFGRSRDLTRGSRWIIFATLLIFTLVYFLLAFAMQGFSTTGMIGLYKSNFIVAMFIGVIAAIVQTTVLTSFLNALYCEAKFVNEGAGNSGLKDIFA